MARRVLSSLLVSLVFASLFAGCAKPKGPPVPPRPPSIVHEVRYPGETLAIISAWYTGDPKNWQEIAAFNDGLTPNKIRIGDHIEVPRYLLKRENPFSKEYVKKFSKPAKTMDGESSGGTKTDGSSQQDSNSEASGSTSSAAPVDGTGEGTSMPPSEDSDDSAPPSVEADDAGSGAASSEASASEAGGQESSAPSAQQDRESLREKTRFELLEEILKGEEKGGGEGAPSAGAPK